MPTDILMGRPECSEEVDEPLYVQVIRERLEDAYEVAREHLKLSANRQKRYYDVRANEQPFNLEIWLVNERSEKNREMP